MGATTITGSQIKDGSVQRKDLDVATSGQAVVRKIVAGPNISISYDGADSGTGDVTITATGIGIGTQANADYLRWRDAADLNDLNILAVDASNNTVLNGGKSTSNIKLNINGNTVYYIDASGNLTQDATNGGDIVFAKSAGVVRSNTALNSDTNSLVLAGGGAALSSRGGLVIAYGKNHATLPGAVNLEGGAVSTGNILLSVNNASAGIVGRYNGSNFVTITPSAATLAPAARPAQNSAAYTFGGDSALIFPAINANTNSESKAVHVIANDAPIAAEVKDDGFRAGIEVEQVFNKSTFAGELSANVAIAGFAGTDTSAPTGTIDFVCALYSEIKKGPNTLFGVSYGIYQKSADANTQNYFQNPVGVGTSGSVESGHLLQVGGSSLLDGDLKFSATQFNIGANTADGSDSSLIYISGGGGQYITDGSRGASLRVSGNESALAGQVDILSGNSTGGVCLNVLGSGVINFNTQNASRWTIDTNGVLVGNQSTNLVRLGADSSKMQLTAGSADGASYGATLVLNGHTALSEAGNVLLSATAASNAAVTITAPSSSGKISLNVNGSERVKVDASGRVGIGESSPAYALDVIGSARLASASANAADKFGRIYGRPYTNADGDFLAIDVRGVSGANGVNIGGGLASANCATSIAFITAANTTTTTGTTRLTINSSAVTSTLPIVAPLGAVGAPSYTFTGDLSTGLFSSGASTLNFATGGTERVRINSSGNVGIGESSPTQAIDVVGSAKLASPRTDATLKLGRIYGQCYNNTDGDFMGLELRGASGSNSVLLGSNSGSYKGVTEILFNTNPSATSTSPVERMRINASGDIGIGTTSPSNAANYTTAQVSGSSGGRILLESTGTPSVRGWVNSSSEISCYDYTASRYIIRLDSSGNVGIGGVAPSELLHLRSSAPRIRLEDTDGSASIYAQISGNSATGNLVLQADPGNAAASTFMAFEVDGTERARIDSSAVTSTLPVVHPLGAVATPSVTFSGDLNTGVYSSGADTLDFATNGVNRFSISTSAVTSTLPVVHPLGSVSAPSLTFAGDLNTGIYSSAADTVDIATGGSQRVTIDSSGQVGIGVSPSELLHLKSAAPRIRLEDTDGSSLIYAQISANSATGNLYLQVDPGNAAASSFMAFEVDGSERARIDSSGRLGIRVTSPTAEIDVDGNVKLAAPRTDSTIKIGRIYGMPYTNADGDFMAFEVRGYSGANSVVIGSNSGVYKGVTEILFNTSPNTTSVSPVERMRIDSAGRIGIGRTPSNDSGLNINITSSFIVRSVSAGTINTSHFAFANGNGDVGFINTSGSGTNFQTTSDYRLKENIEDLEDALVRVNALKPRRFNFKADPSLTVDGFIAHELQEVIPDCVSGYKDEIKEDGSIKPQAVDYSRLTPLLAAALKELNAKVDTLEAEKDALEARLAALESK